MVPFRLRPWMILVVCALCIGQTGCLLTKVLTVPMRAVGAGFSIIPGVGNAVDATLDTAADAVDKLPL